MIAPIVVKAVAVGAVAEVATLVLAQAAPTDKSAIWVAAFGSVTSVILALINYRLAKRTEHTVNSKTSLLEAKIESLKELNTAKDATIIAQLSPMAPAVQAPMPVVIEGAKAPVPVKMVKETDKK